MCLPQSNIEIIFRNKVTVTEIITGWWWWSFINMAWFTYDLSERMKRMTGLM